MNENSFNIKYIKNKQDYFLFEKAGSKNKEIVYDLILNYDIKHPILKVISDYISTPDLKIAIENFLNEREKFLSKVIDDLKPSISEPSSLK
jgi:hypothetical protein